jgi:hypothetical protein
MAAEAPAAAVVRVRMPAPAGEAAAMPVEDAAAQQRRARLLEAERALLRNRVRMSGVDCAACAQPLTAGTTALLPCMHTVHRPCALADVEQGAVPVRCRECGTQAAKVTTADDVATLPANPFAEARLAVRVPCAACRSELDVPDCLAATHRCLDCAPERLFCSSHATLHPIGRVTKDHRVDRLLEDVARTPTCHAHANQALEHYCVHCDRPVCRLCAVSDCKSHTTPALAVHAPVLLAALAELVQEGAAYRTVVETWLARTSEAVEGVPLRTERLTNEIRALYAGLRRQLQEREEALCRAVADEGDAEVAQLRAKQDDVRLLWLALHGADNIATTLRGGGAAAQPGVATPLEVGLLASKTMAQLRAAATQVVPATPAAAAQIDFVTVPADLDRVLHEAGRLVHFGYGPCSTFTGLNNARASMIIEVAAGIVTASTKAGVRRTTGGDRVCAWLVGPGPQEARLAVAVTDRQDGTYTLVYPPVPAPSKYRLIVELNEGEVAGTPLEVEGIAFVPLRYTGPPCYDSRGLFYWLGTARGTRAWQNPHDSGALRVTLSSVESGSANLLVANVAPQANSNYYLYTSNQPNSWMAVALRDGVRVRPTGYVVSTDAWGASGSQLLRNWQLQGSVDGQAWTTLRTHTDDGTLTQQTVSAYWPVEGVAAGAYYAHVRLLQTGMNRTGYYVLCATSLEVYGDVIVTPQ